MDAREKAVNEYDKRNFLKVYGHQDQIKDAFKSGWDKAFDYLSTLPLDDMMDVLVQYIKSKEVKK